MLARFRILRARGPNSQQAHDVVTTSMRRNDVVSTSFRRHVPTRFFNNSVPNNYISHLKIWYYRKFKNELKGIVLPVPSNQISYIYYYFTLQLGTFVIFSCFTQKLKEMWVDYWGGGQSVCCPPPPPHSSYAYDRD